MPDDVILGKTAIIERCLRQVSTYYRGHEAELETDFMRQDAILLNLQRTAEATIDLAMHVVRVRGLGLPRDSREAFTLLETAALVDPETARRMRAIVGFRNVAVHHYRPLDIGIVRDIIEHRQDDLLAFTRQMLGLADLAP